MTGFIVKLHSVQLSMSPIYHSYSCGNKVSIIIEVILAKFPRKPLSMYYKILRMNQIETRRYLTQTSHLLDLILLQNNLCIGFQYLLVTSTRIKSDGCLFETTYTGPFT